MIWAIAAVAEWGARFPDEVQTEHEHRCGDCYLLFSKCSEYFHRSNEIAAITK
jgi:hypothetical protein